MPENRNDMEQQLIVFIAPKKFHKLLGQQTSRAINFAEDDDDDEGEPITRYLNDSSSIVYLKNDGSIPKVSGFNEKEAESAAALLIPDSYTKFQYTPTKPFKILFHNDRASKGKIDDLKKSIYFSGELKSMEEPQYPYDDLARAICKIVAIKLVPNKVVGNAIDLIWEEIPDFDSKLEEKLKLLQKVNAGETLTNDAAAVFQLDEKIKEFQSAFNEFSKYNQDYFELLTISETKDGAETNAFDEYKRAYDKLYDDLDIE